MWRMVLGRLLVLAVLSPLAIPFSPAAAEAACLCTQQACCRPGRVAGAPACHQQAPRTDESVLRCAHGLRQWTLHVATAAPLPSPTDPRAAAGPATPVSTDSSARPLDRVLPPPGPPPRPLAA
jgi:hypothetical protein